MTALLMWVLIVLPTHTTPPTEHGPYADLESCNKVKVHYDTIGALDPFAARRKTACVPVKIFVKE